MEFRGVYSVLVTPFRPDGELDTPSLKRLIDFLISEGVDGVTALGATGEVSMLSDTERMRVIETTLEHVNGRVTVIIGASADGRHACIENCRVAESAGATAVMISPPRMQKINSHAVFDHYSEIRSAVQIPIVIQDYPPLSGYAMEASLLARIACEIPGAQTIKLEDPPTPLKTSRILALAPNVSIQILGGLGGLFMLEELMEGATGVMTGFAYPAVLVKVMAAFGAGNIDKAAEIFYAHVPLIRFEFQEGIGLAIRKEILSRRGAIASAIIREPSMKVDPGTLAALDRILAWTATRGELQWI